MYTRLRNTDKFVMAVHELLKHPRQSLTLLFLKHFERDVVIPNLYSFKEVDILDVVYPYSSGDIKVCSFLNGGSWVMDYFLLRQLAKKLSVKNKVHYMEFGTFRGESVANVADIAERCVCLTLSEKDIMRLLPEDMGARFCKTSNIYLKGLHNVELIKENSLKFDFSKIKGKFNLIFIDADHSYKAVKSDTRNAFKLLKSKKNCIIVWHDYCKDTETIRPEVVCAIYDAASEEQRKHIYHVSNTLCAIYYPFEIISYDMPKQPRVPYRTFSVDIRSLDI